MLNTLFGDLYLKFLSNNRLERIWKLAQVDFKKRYYNDKLGLLWALLNPVLQVIIYYLVFNNIMDRGTEDFAFFLFSGLIVWTSYLIGTKQSLNIFKMKRYLIENIQFNKLDLFFSHLLSTLLGFLFNIIAYLIIALSYGIEINFVYALFMFPLVLIVLYLIIFGSSMLLSTLAIHLKDISHIWDFVLLFGFWTAGIFFPIERIMDKFPALLYANPMLGIIANTRNLLMLDQPMNWEYLLVNLVQGVIIVIIGSFIYRRYSGSAIEKL